MDKIAFVVVRYGTDICGGAEYHCRMLAERLAVDYDVDVLTTTAKNYDTFENAYPEGTERLNGVSVKRFTANPAGDKSAFLYGRKLKLVRKFRRTCYRIGILKYLAKWFPVWNVCDKEQQQFIKTHISYSEGLMAYLQQNLNNYSCVFLVNYHNSLTMAAAGICRRKSIYIPTAHYESFLFLPVYTKIFSNVGYIAFNARAEQKMCENIFGLKNIAPNSVVATGIENISPSVWENVEQKFGLTDTKYILYVGRLDPYKLSGLLPYFKKFKSKYPSIDVKLVIAGKGDSIENSTGVLCTGFVSEEDKAALIQHARVVVNPSSLESLSLIVLEAMSAKTPVLLNGKSDVLRDHVKNSKAGYYYTDYKSFEKKLYTLLMLDNKERAEMGNKGKAYVESNYDWPLIMSKLKTVINHISSN